MVYYIYREKSGYWRWRLIDARGMSIVNSEEHYTDEVQCSAAVELIRTSGLAPVCVLRHGATETLGMARAAPVVEERAALNAALCSAALH